MRNPENNYRHYASTQLLTLNFVTTLSELEIPLKTIAELRTERDPVSFLELLEKQERQMDMEMRNLRQRYSIIHARRELINLGIKVDTEKISIMHMDDKAMTIWPRNEYAEGENFLVPLADFVAQTGFHHINLSFPVAGYYDSLESFSEAPDRPDHFLSLDPIGTYTRKSGDYLVGYARGFYGDIGDLPQRMMAHAKENSIALTGPLYLMYLHEEICTLDPSQYLAQCSIALAKRRVRDSVGDRRQGLGDRRQAVRDRRRL